MPCHAGDIRPKLRPGSVDSYFSEDFIQHDPVSVMDWQLREFQRGHAIRARRCDGLTVAGGWRSVHPFSVTDPNTSQGRSSRLDIPFASTKERLQAGEGRKNPRRRPILPDGSRSTGRSRYPTVKTEETAHPTAIQTDGMVDLQFDRIKEFIVSENYRQHSSTTGDGIARLKVRIAGVAKGGGRFISHRASL